MKKFCVRIHGQHLIVVCVSACERLFTSTSDKLTAFLLNTQRFLVLCVFIV